MNETTTMIVTIDGPAGAGKSSVSRALARRLGYRFLDTGAMYRAVAFAALQRNVDLQDSDALAVLVKQLEIDLQDDRVLLDGEDVSEAIREPRVTRVVRFVADSVPVRNYLSVLQRRAAVGGNIVTEGRDQGTRVFPQAQCKIFLTASPTERARRRYQELQRQGIDVTPEDVLRQQTERDRHDSARPVGRLEKAEDAVEICTDGLPVEAVIDRLEDVVRQRQSPSDVS